jgi:hypothetical protein
LEIFNEACIYALAVNFLLFTDWEDSTNTRWGGGYSADVIIIANFVINLLFVFYVELKLLLNKICRKRRASRKAPYLKEEEDNLVEVNLDGTYDHGDIVPVDVDVWTKKPKKRRNLKSSASSRSDA